MMTNVKEYLSSLARCSIIIEQRQQQRDELASIATWPFPAATKALCTMKETDRIINEQKHIRERIISQIRDMEKPLHSKFLTMRYVEEKTILQIAEEMHYSDSSINRLHKAALSAFERQYREALKIAN